MLALTRRPGETITIGDPANPIGRISIAAIRGNTVQLGFDFPREIEVHRTEYAEQLLQRRAIEASKD